MNMTMDLNLSKRLKVARGYLQLSQEYVAKQMDIHRTSLVAIEAGKRKVTSELIQEFYPSIKLCFGFASKATITRIL